MTQRIFTPGSEWLYFKIYTGHRSADDLLIYYIYPLVKQLINDKDIEQWFFIRYSDPNFHIRLRFKTIPEKYGKIFTLFNDHFSVAVCNGLTYKIQCDTYIREIERYGEDTVELSEEFFFRDSSSILLLLNELRNSTNIEQDRWLLSLVLIDNMLDPIHSSIEDKSEFMNGISQNFKVEFGFTNPNYLNQIAKKYRHYTKAIEQVFLFNGSSSISKYLTILTERQKSITNIMIQIQQITRQSLSEKEALNRQNSLLSSYVHMTMNRLFLSDNRTYELVIYDFLSRYYKSRIMRNNSNLV